MNYKTLLERLQGFTPEQLEQTATVYCRDYDEYFIVTVIGETDESCDVLDSGHKILKV